MPLFLINLNPMEFELAGAEKSTINTEVFIDLLPELKQISGDGGKELLLRAMKAEFQTDAFCNGITAQIQGNNNLIKTGKASRKYLIAHLSVKKSFQGL